MHVCAGILLILTGLAIAAGLTESYIQAAKAGVWAVPMPIVYGCIAGFVFFVLGTIADSGGDTIQQRDLAARYPSPGPSQEEAKIAS